MRVYNIKGSSWSVSSLASPLRRVLKLPLLQPPPSPRPYPPPAATSTLRSLVLFLPAHFYSSRSSIIPAEEASLTPSMGSQATETEWPAKKVRETFIKFFEDKAHVNWISSPVVPHNDPTLLFANAGKFSLLVICDLCNSEFYSFSYVLDLNDYMVKLVLAKALYRT